MSIKIGNSTIGSLFVGAIKIGKAFVGNNLVYESNHEPYIPEIAPYVEFNCETPFKLMIWDEADGTQWSYSAYKPWSGTMEYSVNGSSWSAWSDATTSISSGLVDGNYIIRLRGINNTTVCIGKSINGATHYPIFKLIPDDNTSLIWGLGNIGALMDYQKYVAGTISSTEFKYTIASRMFKKNAFLKTPLEMPPTLTEIVGGASFYQTYRECTNLIRTPKHFPATSIAGSAYQSMFEGCSNLIKGPENIDVTTISGEWAMGGMFHSCSKMRGTIKMSSIENIPNYALYYTFYNCTNFEGTPGLNISGTIGAGGCESTFRNCESLTVAPQNLNISSLGGISSCDKMFNGCKSLTGAINMSSITNVPKNAMRSMFNGCTKFEGTPGLSISGTIGEHGCESMFLNCESLQSISIGTISDIASYGMSQMFANCINLKNVIGLKILNISGEYGCSSMFGCDSGIIGKLENVPSDMLSELKVIPNYGLKNMFSRQVEMTTELTMNELEIGTSGCYYMFFRCEKMPSPVGLVIKSIAEQGCRAMFQQCKAITTPPIFTNTLVATNGARYMFSSCTALKKLPELPATSIGDNGYRNMFASCSKIKLSSEKIGDYQTAYRLPSSGTGTIGTDSLASMFASTGGTFISTPTINTIYYTSNEVV